jgi:hypothetical protein
VTGGNNGRIVDDSVRVDVAVLASQFANITVEDDTIRPYRSVGKGEASTQSFVVRNDGNLPINAVLEGDVFDSEGNVSSAWSVEFSPKEITSLGVGETQVVEVTIAPSKSAMKGLMSTEIRLIDANQQVGVIQVETTVSSVESSGGLFAVLPPYLSIPLVGIIALVGVVLALRMKRSGEIEDDGNDLVAPDAFVNPDHLGTRRDDALDIGHAVNEIASAEVSQDEIAAALAQSLNLPAAPAAVPKGLPPSSLPAGLPPLGRPPAGLPPAGLPGKNLPSLPLPAPSLPMPAPTAAPPAAGPPLPPSGLPAGWTMEQWQHYGHQWLQRQGQ